MADLNVWSGTGRLGSDPEKRATGNGTKVAGFSLAVSGRNKDDTTWLRCSAYGKLAEIIAEYAQKGRQVAISGALQVREWDDRDGNKRTSVEINVSSFCLVGPNPNKSSDDGGWGHDRKNGKPSAQEDPWNKPQGDSSGGW